jgi:hypothetical protein
MFVFIFVVLMTRYESPSIRTGKEDTDGIPVD